ncbi:hypothetical protein ACHAWC_010527 [Mediolabrus comicus]
MYKIRWDGYESKDDTWEPLENIAGTGHVDKYERSLRERTLSRNTPGVAVVRYDGGTFDGEQQTIDLRREKFREWRDDDMNDRKDNDVNNFEVVSNGGKLDLFWSFAGMYVDCTVISFTPLRADNPDTIPSEKKKSTKKTRQQPPLLPLKHHRDDSQLAEEGRASNSLPSPINAGSSPNKEDLLPLSSDRVSGGYHQLFSPDNTSPSFGGNSQAIGTPTDHSNNLTSVSAFWDGQDVTPPFYPINHYNASPVNYDNAFNNFDGSNYEATHDYTHSSGGGDAAPNQHYFGMGIVYAPTNPNHASVDESTTPAEATTKKRRKPTRYVGWKGENMEKKLKEYLEHYNSGGEMCPKDFCRENELAYEYFLMRLKELCPNWSPNRERNAQKRFATILKKEKPTDLKWMCGHCGVGTRNFPIENFDEDGVPILLASGDGKGCPNVSKRRKCPIPDCDMVPIYHRNWRPDGWKVVIRSQIVGEDEEEDDKDYQAIFESQGDLKWKCGKCGVGTRNFPIECVEDNGSPTLVTEKKRKGYPKTTSSFRCTNTNCGKRPHMNWYPCGWKVVIGWEIVSVGEDEEKDNQGADEFGLSPHDLDGEKVPAAQEGENEKEVQVLLDQVEPGTLTEL